MKIPTGCLFTHIIRGGGEKITYQNADVDCAFVGALSSGFCTWRIDFTYANTNSKTYRTSRGRTHEECKIDPMRNNSPQAIPRYGKACAHLYANRVRRASQCHTSRSEPFMNDQQQGREQPGETLGFRTSSTGGRSSSPSCVGALTRWICRSRMGKRSKESK